ncbi:MAG: type II toxin-antitoxin system RelE/ParE family toxin [Sphingobacteriales bacterium]|jgi:mRNA interferase RelE/StbE|nr:type II toxin-antitoxin system RelE/ParE family toxin [Sphingobacteriales bacterium]
MYSIVILRSAQKDIALLPKSHYQNVVNRIQSLKENPRPSGCKKLVGSINEYRIRVGDYRVLYTISDSILKILVIKVKHRKGAY